MKRIVVPALVALCLLLWPARKPSLADVSKPLDLSALQWKLLQPTITKTDLGGDLPEVVVMTLTNPQFQPINGKPNDALKYLNDLQIFKKRLLKVVFCNVQPSVEPYDSNADWILIVPHTYQSTAFIVAWQMMKTKHD